MSTAHYPIVGSMSYFTTAATLRNGLEIQVDFDICAQLDIVSIDFAKKQHLKQVNLRAPQLCTVGELKCPNYGVYQVPLTLVDSRGTAKTIERPCVAVDQDPNPANSPVLLLMTTLSQYSIIISTANQQWWFTNPKFELRTPHQFTKDCKNEAHIFTIIQLPNSALQPTKIEENKEEKTSGPTNNLTEEQRIPPELKEFSNIFSHENTTTLPSQKETDHAIDLQEGEQPPWGPIYALSQTELTAL